MGTYHTPNAAMGVRGAARVLGHVAIDLFGVYSRTVTRVAYASGFVPAFTELVIRFASSLGMSEAELRQVRVMSESQALEASDRALAFYRTVLDHGFFAPASRAAFEDFMQYQTRAMRQQSEQASSLN